ncbi:DUF3693 domain-containing protein [Stenotrophomonas indicatrix]|uniref:DUF3693 domain-containing protein n=1 Tax=Stenotrophomonas indicatrix TaxID=2045451 RepID=UPI003CCEB193
MPCIYCRSASFAPRRITRNSIGTCLGDRWRGACDQPRRGGAVWRKLAATAVALCLAVGFALPRKAQAAATGFNKTEVYTLAQCSTRRIWTFVGSGWQWLRL